MTRAELAPLEAVLSRVASAEALARVIGEDDDSYRGTAALGLAVFLDDTLGLLDEALVPLRRAAERA